MQSLSKITKSKSCEAYRLFAVFSAVFVFSYIATSVFAPVQPSDAQEVEIKNDVTGYFIRISNSDSVSLSVSSTPSGTLASAKDTINVKTNVPTGYQLYISATTSDLYEENDAEKTGTPISAINATLNNKKPLGQNTWGFTTSAVDVPVPSSSATFAAVPDDGTELISETSSPDESGVDTDIYFGVNVNTSLASGNYTTTVYYTATAEGATEPFMQDFTSADCSAMSTDSTVRLMDSRNAEIYTIVKAKDGNCWMADNLQIDDVTIYPSNSNIRSGSFYIPESSNWSGNITDQAKLHIATNSGYEGEHYYNWFTATAGSTASSGTVDQSICPKGWRLPINGDATQDKSWAKLFDSYRITTGNDLVSSTILGFAYRGFYYYGGAEYYQGSQGRFWSASPSAAHEAYTLHYSSSSNIEPQVSHYKGDGDSIRCVFEGETIQDIATMQEMTGTICNNTRTGLTARLKDVRGSYTDPNTPAEYGVIKAKDGNCWMTDNLNLYDITITSDDSDFPANADGTTATYKLPESTNWTSVIYTEPLAHRATNSGYTNQVYYNWTSAVALQNGSTSEQQNQSICPKNWQLPVNGDSSTNKSLPKLLALYGVADGSNLNNTSQEYATLNIQFSGGWAVSTRGEYGQGSCWYYWTSTPYDDSRAYITQYWANKIYYSSPDNKGYGGYTIRCVNRD